MLHPCLRTFVWNIPPYVGVPLYIDQYTSKLRIITPMASKVHVILQSFVVLTWMRDTIELV